MKKQALSLFVFLFSGFQLLNAQTHSVTGIVKDEKGKPLHSATVQVKDTKLGTITDSSGLFIINASTDAFLLISRIGYADTMVNVNNQSDISIVLRSTINALSDVSVKGRVKTDPQQTGASNGTINDQAIANGLSDAKKSSYSGSTPQPTYQTGPEGVGSINAPDIPAVNTIYFGGSVPIFSAPKETRGSRYMFADWVKGKAYTQSGDAVNNNDLVFNYDKVGRKLLVTADRKILVEVDKSNLQSFSLTNSDGEEYHFERVDHLNPDLFYQTLVKNISKYSLYKLLSTNFVKSDYHSDGLVESGTPYDEYVDTYEYYIVMPDGKSYQKLTDLKAKSIKTALSNESVKVDAYFSDHKHEDVNEYFLSGLIDYLNK